ncbi:serine hydrolase domain-containing protein [uncultured Desulfobacter sp.]|uniref:serine hydrolase domain-containing protein n=1 Tax=uncultured Desulfobacter sp. TaxID=240139 RepID=UPI002AAAA521|nr:serine hydrolase domain-containing protein [uncultured Desulfobacter sp.]
MTIPTILNELQAHLEQSLERNKAVGASLAVLFNNKVYTAAAGKININTGVDVTEDAVFQIGSATKVFTATLVMQLAGQGRLTLDDPVKKYLPEFKIADPTASANVTIRHLLSHTSGIDGDFFEEADYGREKLMRFLDKCTLLPQAFPMGKGFSYCNAGWIILGRMVEVITGRTWEENMIENIFNPLGMDHAVVHPGDTLKFRSAIGHIKNPETGKFMPSPHPYLMLSNAPAGATTTMRAKDLITFARMHFDNGKAPGGKQVLQEKSVKEMQTAQVTLPPRASENYSRWGLGWAMIDYEKATVIGHDGTTFGQHAYFRTVPEKKFAVALLTNCDHGGKVYKELFPELFSQLLGVDMNAAAAPNPPAQIDLDRYIGRYETIAAGFDVFAEDGALFGTMTAKTLPEEVSPPETYALAPADKDCFLMTCLADPENKDYISFLGNTEDGHPESLFLGLRMMIRS